MTTTDPAVPLATFERKIKLLGVVLDSGGDLSALPVDLRRAFVRYARELLDLYEEFGKVLQRLERRAREERP